MARLAEFPEPMTFNNFERFLDTRPDHEKWELIEGELFLNASPNFPHQRIVANLIGLFHTSLRTCKPAVVAIPGIGVRLSDFSAPVPDVLIRPKDGLRSSFCDDMIVAFEVLSPSTAKHDLDWKLRSYTGLASLSHYVVVSADRVDVRVYAREHGWAEQRVTDVKAAIDVRQLGIEVPVAAIYDEVEFDSA